MALVWGKTKGAGVLDYVTAWYAKAAAYIQNNKLIDVAFVATNSISQGEQVAVLWTPLLKQGLQIRFAHRSFRWSNEGKGNAAVHCVILGFGLRAPQGCLIFDHKAKLGEAVGKAVQQINGYLIDAKPILLIRRPHAICESPVFTRGSQPSDGGNLLLSDVEKVAFLDAEPEAAQWVRPYLMGDEFINGVKRWCLWLQGIPPSKLRKLPLVYARVEAVRAMRLASKKIATRDSASTPYLFAEIKHVKAERVLVIPVVSSERRHYIPIDWVDGDTICGNKLFFSAQATGYHFAVLTSTMHNAWMRAVCGRMKSDYSYSNTIVYNNFPWPESVCDKQKQTVEAAASAVLKARALYPNSSLADLYDPLTMPSELQRAHKAVDKAVDAAYAYTHDKTDAARVSFLFERHNHLATATTRL